MSKEIGNALNISLRIEKLWDATEAEKRKQSEEAKMRTTEYRNNLKPIKDVILLSKNFAACPLWQKIENDIEEYKKL